MHASLFGFAPMPLLMRFGSLMSEKTPAQTYQLRRAPEPSWKWKDDGPDLGFTLTPPPRPGYLPALVFSISAKVDHARVHAVVGEDASVWEVTIAAPHNDCLTTRAQLEEFKRVARKAVADIGRAHGSSTTLRVFPAMPVATAIEFGRIRMPKADMPWEIYDQSRVAGNFAKALTIG